MHRPRFTVSRRPRPRPLARAILALGFSLLAVGAIAGPLLDGMKERREARAERRAAGSDKVPRGLPAGTTMQRDVAYGTDPKQKFDVYFPPKSATASEPAPILFMVHGGAWKLGDKSADNVVINKAARWLPRGFILVSVNYRFVPHVDVLRQADDVARALAFVQNHAADYGGDPSRVVLMGHSAGAHLVGLISAHPTLAADVGAKPWLGSVLLDSAALDLVEIMERGHYGFYDDVFGKDPARWKAASPFHVLRKPVPPMLAVCSSRRDDSPAQANAFAKHAATLGTRVVVLPQDLSHGDINDDLGRPGKYTDAVEDFLRSLDPKLAARLGPARAKAK